MFVSPLKVGRHSDRGERGSLSLSVGGGKEDREDTDTSLGYDVDPRQCET